MNAHRIRQINLADQRSGAERIALALHRGYRERGREAHLHVGERHTAEPHVHLIDNDGHRSVWVRPWVRAWHAAARRLEAGDAAGLAKAARACARPAWAWRRWRGREDHAHPGTAAWLEALRGDPPDVIHAHNLHGGYFDLRRLPDLCRIAPVVITLQDAWLMLDGPAYAELPHPPRRSPHNLALKRAIFSRSRLRIAAPCRWLLDQVSTSILAPAVVEARRVPNGIDTRLFHPQPAAPARDGLGIDPASHVVLFVGRTARTNPAKDFDTVREAVRRAAELVPEESWTLLVLGDSGESEAIGRAHLRCIGPRTDPAEVAAVYAAADVLAHAAHADTFPLVVLEALAAGRPVVATEIGGVGEQIDDPHTGHLVPRADAAAMGEALAALARDPQRREAMGRAARADAEARFDHHHMIDQYLSWFDQIAGSPGDAAAPSD